MIMILMIKNEITLLNAKFGGYLINKLLRYKL